MGYGDEGKGSVTDFLTREYDIKLIIRYNGGPQAAHNVVTPEGVHHCFSQFGSGTMIPGVKTYLSPYMYVDPIGIKNENDALGVKGITDALERLHIHKDCPLITPYHQYMNRIEELARGGSRHGSCGVGMGQAYRDSLDPGVPTLYYGTLIHTRDTEERLRKLKKIKLAQAARLAMIYPDNEPLQEQYRRLYSSPSAGVLATYYYSFVRGEGISLILNEENFLRTFEDDNILFEGAQGVLLDIENGFWPHVTPSDITTANAGTLITAYFPRHEIKKMGIIRAFLTRHGSGPFITEEETLSGDLNDPNNQMNPWQGRLRKGWLDLPALRYSLNASGEIDELVLTNLDLLEGRKEIKLCTAYEPVFKEEDMDDCFEQSTDKDDFSFTGIKRVKDKKRRSKLTGYLNKCLPRYKTVPGWPQSMINKDTPHPDLQRFLDYLQSPRGLDKKITLLSHGPRAGQKQWIT